MRFHPIVACLSPILILGCSSAPRDVRHQVTNQEWHSLFDVQTLGPWASTPFGGEGKVYIEDGAIVMSMGSPMTGVTWQGQPPFRSNYEMEFDAIRTLGNDFFCALTFPVGPDYLSLILAGWGGSIVGLSNLNGADASQNETTTFLPFKNDQWYHVRLNVRDERVQAWVDDKQVIDADLSDKALSIRPEVERSKPLGFASWTSEGRLKNIRWRKIGP